MTARVWGYGRAMDGSLAKVRFDDIEQDERAASDGLRALGLRPGDHIACCVQVSRLPWMWPYMVAALDLRLVVSQIEASALDAARLAMFVSRLPIRAVFGVNTDICDGLRTANLDPAVVFASVPTVVAADGAADVLHQCGVRVRRWVSLGPLSALECRRGRLHFDSAAWRLSVTGSTLTAHRIRLDESAGDVDTGVAGTVDTAPCSCGRRDASVVLDA